MVVESGLSEAPVGDSQPYMNEEAHTVRPGTGEYERLEEILAGLTCRRGIETFFWDGRSLPGNGSGQYLSLYDSQGTCLLLSGGGSWIAVEGQLYLLYGGKEAGQALMSDLQALWAD